MLDSAHQTILERLRDDDLVLDVGGWANPFTRADWVIDLMPYETRGPEGYVGNGERFGAERWVCRDICDHEPWPFEDDMFDFAICSHTLEDVRDPVWVCHELSRVAKAGYIEVPSRLEEQTYWLHGPWVGWGHHHWLTELRDDGVEFVFKHHILHGKEQFRLPREVWKSLPREDRVLTLWWQGSFDARERVFFDLEELDRWLEEPVAPWREQQPAPAPAGGLLRRWRSRLSSRTAAR